MCVCVEVLLGLEPLGVMSRMYTQYSIEDTGSASLSVHLDLLHFNTYQYPLYVYGNRLNYMCMWALGGGHSIHVLPTDHLVPKFKVAHGQRARPSEATPLYNVTTFSYPSNVELAL